MRTGLRAGIASALSVCAVGCYAAHELRRVPHDAAHGDAGPDAGCVPAREVPSSCRVAWAHAWNVPSSPEDPYQIRAIEVAHDGTVLVGVDAFDAAFSFDFGGQTLHTSATLALDPSGRPRWTQPGTNGPLVAGDTVWGALDDRSPRIEQWSLATGVALAELNVWTSGSWHATFASCDDCPPGFVLATGWDTSLDLGPLGTRSGAYGMTVFGMTDTPRWDLTTPIPSLDHSPVYVLLPRRASVDGSAIVGSVDQSDPSLGYHLCPVPGGPCAPMGGALVVSLGPRGEVRWTAPQTAAFAIEMLSDGGAVVAGDDLLRYDASGSVVWHAAQSFVGAIAVDETRGRVWSAVGLVSGRTVDIGGARVRDCHVCPSPCLAWPTLLVAFDLATGDAIDAWLPVDGLQITAVAVRPDGGVVLGGSMVTPTPTVSVCGTTLMRDDAPGQPIPAVVASLDPS